MENSRSRSYLLLAGLLVASGLCNPARAQQYPAPVAGPVSGGSYTISFQPNCAGSPIQVACAFTYLQERQNPGGSWTTLASGTGSASFENKPIGSYSYRVYAGVYDAGLNIYSIYSPEITVFVSATSQPRADILTQMSYRYQVRQGDINGDGRKDLYLRKSAGGNALDGTIDRVILRQTSQGQAFTASVPSEYEASVAAGWSEAPIEAIVADVNVDGFVDVTLSGIDSVIAGSADQIVLASGQPGVTAPLGLRPYDTRIRTFASDMLDYFADQQYFIDNVAYGYFGYLIWYEICDPWAVDEFRSDYNGLYWPYYVYCYTDFYYLYGVYQDYSAFSDEALLFWANDQDARNGYMDEERALTEVEQAVETLIGAPIGGWPMEEILGPHGEHKDPFVRRGIEIGQSVLGQARGGRNRTTSRLVPPQETRVPDRIYITGHPLAFARSRGHLALEYTDIPSGNIPYTGTTISAEPENNNFFNFGKMFARDNRPSDHPLLNFLVGTVEPLNTSNYNYWNGYLQRRHGNYMALPYEQLVDYAIVPSASAGTYNSNGYISGVSQDSPSNVTIEVPFGIGARYPGWNGPVPDAKFR